MTVTKEVFGPERGADRPPVPRRATEPASRACDTFSLTLTRSRIATMVSPVSVPEASAAHRRTMGRYVISTELGRGAMGTVYCAEDPLIERNVALKVLALDPRQTSQADFRERFFREAKAAGRLNHPNIVTIHDVGEDSDGTPYIAMELLPGLTLRDSLDSGIVVPLHKIIDVAMLVLRGLDYAHQQGIVHRDIKPANIMLARNGMVKIMDFGIALAVDAGKELDDLMLGSPSHMAPEQVTSGPVDARTDLFALGVTLYELLTGKSPFAGDSMAAVTHNILHLDPPSPATLNPDVPPELDRVVMQALAKEPAARFASAREMSRALAPIRRMLTENRGASDARSELPGVTGDATKPVPDLDPRSRGLTSSAERKRARPFLRPGILLVGGAAIALLIVLSRLDDGGDAVAPAAPPPAAVASVPATAEPGVTEPEPTVAESPTDPSADLVLADPVVELDPLPSEAEVPSPPTTEPEPEPAVADAAPPEPSPKSQPGPVRGTLGLTVLPWGEVYVNGRKRGVTPPLRALELPPGTYRIEIRNADFPPRIERVKIESAKSISIKHRFQ